MHPAIEPLPPCLLCIENMKQIRRGSMLREVEHCVFTPLVFSTSGGMAHEATIFYKRLAEQLSIK